MGYIVYVDRHRPDLACASASRRPFDGFWLGSMEGSFLEEGERLAIRLVSRTMGSEN